MEAALYELDFVRGAAVVARRDGRGEQSLVAYLVSRDHAVAPSFIRSALSESLPDYMIPSSLVRLDDLPLTPSGKVDRQALLAYQGPRIEPEAIFTEPETALEIQLASIQAELLSVEPIRTTHNFFELGRHSLLSMQMVSRTHDAVHKSIPLRSVYETPTMAGLARSIEGLRWAHSTPPRQAVVSAGGREEGEL